MTFCTFHLYWPNEYVPCLFLPLIPPYEMMGAPSENQISLQIYSALDLIALFSHEVLSTTLFSLGLHSIFFDDLLLVYILFWAYI